jgi:hypothetical protein
MNVMTSYRDDFTMTPEPLDPEEALAMMNNDEEQEKQEDQEPQEQQEQDEELVELNE